MKSFIIIALLFSAKFSQALTVDGFDNRNTFWKAPVTPDVLPLIGNLLGENHQKVLELKKAFEAEESSPIVDGAKYLIKTLLNLPENEKKEFLTNMFSAGSKDKELMDLLLQVWDDKIVKESLSPIIKHFMKTFLNLSGKQKEALLKNIFLDESKDTELIDLSLQIRDDEIVTKRILTIVLPIVRENIRPLIQEVAGSALTSANILQVIKNTPKFVERKVIDAFNSGAIALMWVWLTINYYIPSLKI